MSLSDKRRVREASANAPADYKIDFQMHVGSESRKMFVEVVQIGTIFWCLTVPFESAASRFAAVESRSDGNSFNARAVNYRLPNDTKPETYDLSLRTRIGEGEFDYDGLMTIIVLIVNATRELTIHSKGLRIETIRLSNVNGTGTIALFPPRIYNETDFLTIPTKSSVLLPGSRYRLDIGFSGVLHKERSGFYRAPSVYGITNSRWICQFDEMIILLKSNAKSTSNSI